MRRCFRLLLTLLAGALLVDAQSAPVTSSCGSDETTIMVLQKEKSASGTETQTLTDQTLNDCSTTCAEDDSCAGFNFLSDSSCVFFSDFDADNLDDSSDTDVYQKACVSSDLVCNSPFVFEMKPSFILVGHARDVVAVDTLQECFEACVTSITSNGYECESVMYYPADSGSGECILNTEDRYDRPDLFIEEPDEAVIYFDNNCAGSQCFSPFVTQYIQVEGYSLEDQKDVQIDDISFQSCVELCTQRLAKDTGESFSCKSIMYRESDSTCWFSDERSEPLGRATLVEESGVNYYEKKCFQSTTTCRIPPAFTRVPQYILVGFAAFVIENVQSVTACLDQCTSPPEEAGDFECKSAMYYYNQQECILNEENRDSQPELFIPEGTGFDVDYFDINCTPDEIEECPGDLTATSVKTPDTALDLGTDDIHVLETVTGTEMECRAECYSLLPDKCRSFNYYSDGTCDLMYVNDDTAETVDTAGVDLYTLQCITGANTGDCDSLEDAAFDRYIGKMNSADATETLDGVTALDTCFAYCLAYNTNNGVECQGINYRTNTAQCNIYTTDPGTVPDDLTDDEDFDYYVANCATDVTTTTGGTTTTTETTTAGDDTTTTTSEGQTTTTTEAGTTTTAEALAAGVETICDFSGMRIKVTNDEPFTGAVFAKMKYDTCRVEVENEQMAELILGFPEGTELLRAKRDAYGGSAPAAASGGYGGSAPAASGGYGGSAPAAASGGYGGSAPAAASGGYGGSAPAASGGYGGSAPAAASGGYGGSAPAAASGGYGGAAPGGQAGYGGGAAPGGQAGYGGGAAPGGQAGYGGGAAPGGQAGYGGGAAPGGQAGYGGGAAPGGQAGYGGGAAPGGQAGYGGGAAPGGQAGYGGGAAPGGQAGYGGGAAPGGQAGYGGGAAPGGQAGYGGGAAPGGQAGYGGGAAPGGQAGYGGGAAPGGQAGYGGGAAPGGQTGYGGGAAPGGQAGYGGAAPGGQGGYGGGAAPGGQGGYGGAAPGGQAGYGSPGGGSAPAPGPGNYGPPGILPPDSNYGAPATAAPVTAAPVTSAPKPSRDCGLEDLKNGTFKATIVVQTNNLGIPGLVTSADKIYMVSCDYSNMSGKKIDATAQLGVDGPTASIIQPRGKIELTSPVMMQMMSSGEDGSPVLQANLGDMLELRWEMMALDDIMDFFVRECIAERGGSTPSTGDPDSEDKPGTLKLIEKGCPTEAVSQTLMPEPVYKESNKLKTAKLQAFRFDGSRSVRIICQLEICDGTCNPTTCTINGEEVTSNGRKKRNAHEENTVQYDPYVPETFETRNYIMPRHQKAVASLVIIDPLQEITAMNTNYRAQNKPVEVRHHHSFEAEQAAVEFNQKGKVCLPRSTFLGVFLFLGLLALTQASVVAAYVTKRLLRKF